MLDPHNVRLNIVLSANGIALIRNSGWFKKQHMVLAERVCAEDDLAVQLRSMLAESKCERLPTTITLSDAMVRIWMVTPPQNTVRLSDCQAAAAARFQALYGEPMTDWELSADWDPRQPFLACALPRKLLQTLQSIAQERQLTLLEIAPQFIATWNRRHAQLAPDAWLGVLHGHVLTIGAVHQQRLCGVRVTSLTSESLNDKHWLQQHLKREALRMNLPTPSQLQLCGSAPAHWVIQTAGAEGAIRCTPLESAAVGMPTVTGAALAQAAMAGGRQ